VTGLQDSRWYTLQMQQKQKCAALQTSKKYSLQALALYNFYFSRECNLIYTADNFAMLLVRQHAMHNLSYFSKQVLEIGYL
jgi:hypothetical protein